MPRPGPGGTGADDPGGKMENHNGPISKEDVRRSPCEIILLASSEEEKGSGSWGSGRAPCSAFAALRSLPLGPALDPRTYSGEAFSLLVGLFHGFRRALFAERRHARAPRAGSFEMISARGPGPTAACVAEQRLTGDGRARAHALDGARACCACACIALIIAASRRTTAFPSPVMSRHGHVTAFGGHMLRTAQWVLSSGS
jgi:hypothetical protein